MLYSGFWNVDLDPWVICYRKNLIREQECKFSRNAWSQWTRRISQNSTGNADCVSFIFFPRLIYGTFRLKNMRISWTLFGPIFRQDFGESQSYLTLTISNLYENIIFSELITIKSLVTGSWYTEKNRPEK